MLSRVSEIGLVIPGFAGNIKVFIVILECIWTVTRPRLFAVTLNEWFKSQYIVLDYPCSYPGHFAESLNKHLVDYEYVSKT
jgi:hypothetical protein